MTLEHAQAFRELLDARPETLGEAVVEAANHGAECPQGPVSCVTCLLGTCLIYALGRDGRLTIGEAPPLTFGEVALKNLTRCEQAFHPLDVWSPTDWGCAVAGEVGEACNLAKKLHRGDAIDVQDLGDELADVVLYADLMAQRLGLRLGDCVRRKFNIVSDRVGSSVRL